MRSLVHASEGARRKSKSRTSASANPLALGGRPRPAGPVVSSSAPDLFNFEKFFDLSPDLLCIASLDGCLKRVNPAFEKALGFAKNELLGRPYIQHIHPDDVQDALERTRQLIAGLPNPSFECRCRCKNGTYKWLLWSGVAEPRAGLIHAAARDITQRKQLEAKLWELARLDEMTQLHNRRAFDQRLVVEWNRARRTKTPLAVALIDADHFKAYNDTYGHLAGDDCLRRLASIISECFRRAGDFVARYGGEEFGLILPTMNSKLASLRCQKVRGLAENLDIPPACGGPHRGITVSIGVAGCVPDSKKPKRLLEAADAALYRAKKLGRNRVIEYSEF